MAFRVRDDAEDLPAIRQHLGDKLQALAQLSPKDVRDVERLVDWKLSELQRPPLLRWKEWIKS